MGCSQSVEAVPPSTGNRPSSLRQKASDRHASTRFGSKRLSSSNEETNPSRASTSTAVSSSAASNKERPALQTAVSVEAELTGIPPRAPTSRDNSVNAASSTPPPFPTLASVASFRSETPDSYLMTSSSQRLSSPFVSNSSPLFTADYVPEEKGYFLLHSIAQQRSSYLNLLRACRILYTTLDSIHNNRKTIVLQYRNIVDNTIFVLARCIQHSVNLNRMQQEAEDWRLKILQFYSQLRKYTEDRFFRHLYLSNELQTVLSSMVSSLLEAATSLLDDIDLLPLTVQSNMAGQVQSSPSNSISPTIESNDGRPDKEELRRFLTTSIDAISNGKIICDLQASKPLTAISSEAITVYAQEVAGLMMGDNELAATVEHSLALYLKDCQQQHQIITVATFDIASVLPNIALQELWRRTLPSQSSVNTREFALHLDTELMRDESSLYLSPSSFGFSSSTTSLVDALIDILGTVGKSRREITIFEFARFTMGCEVYWTLAEVVTHWLQMHYADRGVRCLPALSQITPYFVHQGHSLLLRDRQFKLLAEAVRAAPFTIVFGPKQIGKTFRLRHILDEEDWCQHYHTLWIDCAHVVGGEDLPMAMLAAMNAQLYLGQAHPESVLSDFSSLLNFWTKQCLELETQQSRTTCLVFDHVTSSLLSALQPFATLIGSNACKLVMVLSDVDTMDALQYTLSVEPTLVAMISEETCIMEVTAMSDDACRAMLVSYQELAVELRQQQFVAAEADTSPDDAMTNDGVGIAHHHKGTKANNPMTLYSSLSRWQKPLTPLPETVMEHLDDLLALFQGNPGHVAEYCYHHQSLPWFEAKQSYDVSTMVALLSMEEICMLRCLGMIVGALSTYADDTALLFNWRFSLRCLWHLWTTCCGDMIPAIDYSRWLERVWQPLVDKGLLCRYGVSSMTMYPAGEEYTLSRDAMLLFSILLDSPDGGGDENGTEGVSIDQPPVASSCTVEQVMQQFITFWWEEWSTLTEEMLQEHQEYTVALAWFGEHEELLRRLLHYLLREVAASCSSPSASLQTLIQQVASVLVLFVGPHHRWVELLPGPSFGIDSFYPSWLIRRQDGNNATSDDEGSGLSRHDRLELQVLHCLWIFLSVLLAPDMRLVSAHSCFNATSFVVHMVMFRVDTSASYWHPSSSSSMEKVMLSQRKAILWFAFDLGQRLFGLPPSLIAAEAVYDYLDALHTVLGAEVAQCQSSMTDGDESSTRVRTSTSKSTSAPSSTRSRSSTRARSLRVTVDQKNDWSQGQEAYWQFLQYLDAEVCLLLAKLTAAAIRIVRQHHIEDLSDVFELPAVVSPPMTQRSSGTEPEPLTTHLVPPQDKTQDPGNGTTTDVKENAEEAAGEDEEEDEEEDDAMVNDDDNETLGDSAASVQDTSYHADNDELEVSTQRATSSRTTTPTKMKKKRSLRSKKGRPTTRTTTATAAHSGDTVTIQQLLLKSSQDSPSQPSASGRGVEVDNIEATSSVQIGEDLEAEVALCLSASADSTLDTFLSDDDNAGIAATSRKHQPPRRPLVLMPHDDSDDSHSDRDEDENDGQGISRRVVLPVDGDDLDTATDGPTMLMMDRRGVSLTRRWPDEATLLQLLEGYTAQYLQFYQSRYDVTIPTPPPLLPTAVAAAAAEPTSSAGTDSDATTESRRSSKTFRSPPLPSSPPPPPPPSSQSSPWLTRASSQKVSTTPSSPSIPPRSPAVLITASATTPSSSTPSLRPPLSLSSPGSTRGGGSGGLFPPQPSPSAMASFGSTSSFLPARTNRKSRTSGGSLKGSAHTRSVRFMAQPLAELSDLFLHAFSPTDLVARARCLFYYEQSLQCRGKSQREGYDYDSFQYAQALYYYARKVLGKYLLAESVTSGHARGSAAAAFRSTAASGESAQSPRIQLRDEVMRSYMDIQRLLYHKVQFRMTEEVDACLAYTSYYLGMFWYQQQRFDEAIWCFGHVLKRLPTDHWLFESLRTIVADAALYQGNALSQRKRFTDAITAYGHSLTARLALRSLTDAEVRLLAEQSPAGKAFTASHLVRTPSFFSASCQHLFVSSDGPASSQELVIGGNNAGTAGTVQSSSASTAVAAIALNATVSTPGISGSSGGSGGGGDFSRHNSNLSAIHSDVAMITSPMKMTPIVSGIGGGGIAASTSATATGTHHHHHHHHHQHHRQASHSSQQQATLAWMDIAKRYADTYYNFAIACEKENRWEEAMSLLTQALHIRRALITVTQLVPVTWMFLQQQQVAAVVVLPSTMTLATMVHLLVGQTSMTEDDKAAMTVELRSLVPALLNEDEEKEAAATAAGQTAAVFAVEDLSTLMTIFTTLLPASVVYPTAPASAAIPPPLPAAVPPAIAAYHDLVQIIDRLAQAQLQARLLDEAYDTFAMSLTWKQRMLYPEWDSVYSYGNLARRGNVQAASPVPVTLHAAYLASRSAVFSNYQSLGHVQRLRREYGSAWQWYDRAVSEAQKLLPFTTLSSSSSASSSMPPAPSSSVSSSTAAAAEGKRNRRKSQGSSGAHGANGHHGSHHGHPATAEYHSGSESVASSGSATSFGANPSSSSVRSVVGGGGTATPTATSSLISRWEESAQQQQQQQQRCQQVVKLYAEALEAKARLCELLGTPSFPLDQLPHAQQQQQQQPQQLTNCPTTREGFQKEAVRLLQVARTQYAAWFGAHDPRVHDLDKKLQTLWSKYG